MSSLASNLAPCILRPRTESSLTPHERYSYRLIKDLFAHKEDIFDGLKRASSQTSLSSAATRSRAISSNERDRRANMEARAQAIASRSRASSPQPQPGRTHRRDRSVGGGAATRFPIQTSPTSAAERKATRQSLEVPGSDGDLSTFGSENDKLGDTATNGSALGSNGQAESHANTDGDAEKRNSLGRVTGASAGKFPRRVPVGNPTRQSLTAAVAKRDSLSGQVLEEDVEPAERPIGVTLSDKPLDD